MTERAVVAKEAHGGTTTTQWLAATWPQDLEADAEGLFNPPSPSTAWPILVWYQGEENTTSQALVNVFKAETKSILAEFRTAFGANLWIYVCRIHVGTIGLAVKLPEIRALQAEVVAEDALTTLVSVDDLTLQGDNVHLDSASLITLGQRLATDCRLRFGTA